MAKLPSVSVLTSENVLMLIVSDCAGARAAAAVVSPGDVEDSVNWRVIDDARLVEDDAAEVAETWLCATGAELVVCGDMLETSL